MPNFSPDDNFKNTHEDKPESIEAQANFEGNDTLLLFERFDDPVIKEQIVDVHYQIELSNWKFVQEETWEHDTPDDWSHDEIILYRGVDSGEVMSKDLLEEIEDSPKPTKKPVKKEVEKRIEEAKEKTNINYDPNNQPNMEEISLRWSDPQVEGQLSEKQMSIIEAHEKGHVVRKYDGYTEELRKGFDISSVEPKDKFYEWYREEQKKVPEDVELEDSVEDMTREEIREVHLENYLFTGEEIAERMSQLKNYYGMSGDEQFTKEHLEYARENYVADTAMNNGMDLFFQAITDEAEDEFIRLINSSGI